MASFTITIPNDKLNGILDNIANQLNYQEQIEDPDNPDKTITNPESKADRAKRAIREYIRELNKAGAVKAQLPAARKQMQEDADLKSENVMVQ